MNLIEDLKACVIAGHTDVESNYPPEMKGRDGVREIVTQLIQDHTDISIILDDGLIKAMDVVGKKFSSGECFVPEMLMSAQAMKKGLEILEPLLVGIKKKEIGTVIIGTVFGDMHDIGKNLVGLILEGAGYQVIDLGINVPSEHFIAKAKEYPEAIVGMSALLTTTMVNMEKIISDLRNNNLKNKIIIGGAAISQKFADEIHADGYAKDAPLAVPLVKQLIETKGNE